MRLASATGLIVFGCAASFPGMAAAEVGSGTGVPRASLFRSQVSFYAQEQGIPFVAAARLLERQRLAPSLRENARGELHSGFGGVWIDNVDGGRIKLGIASTKPWATARARAAIADAGLSGAVDLVFVARSEAELSAISASLVERLVQANAGADDFLSLGIAPNRNVVRVLLPRGSELTAAQRLFLAEALSRYGEVIETGFYDGQIEATACSYPYCTSPLRAGVRIGPSWTFEGGSAGICSAGFLARGKEDGKLQQFTAGHCDVGAFTWGSKFGSAEPWQEIGAWSNDYIGISGDAGVYQITKDATWNSRPWVYWAGYSDSYPIYSDANPVKGQSVCKSGSFYGTTSCGEVTEALVTTNVDYGSKGIIAVNLVRANFCTKKGDSGSPVHYYGVAYGLTTSVSKTNECNSYFTPIGAAESLMKADVRHESECDPLFESPVKIGDMTGDLKADVFQLPGEGNGWAWESKGTSYTGLGKIGSGFGSTYQDRVGDIDGDGDDDLLQMTDNGDLYAWESKGASYTGLGQISTGFGSACDTRLADINGDSRDDILRFTNDGYGYGWLDKAGGGYESVGQIGTGFGSTYQDRVGDMDGDGDDDLFQITDEGNAYAWHSNGSSYTGKGLVATGLGSASQVRIGDRDGDGDDDLFQFTDSGEGYVWRSNGTSYTALGKIGTGFGLTRQVRVADIDGDLDADILKFADDGNGYAWTFNGSTYASIGKVGSGFGAP